RLELAKRTTGSDRDRQARRRRVVRRLDQREAVRLAEGIPEPAELAARLRKDLADRLLPILGALHESRPDLGLVAKGGDVKRHETLLPEPAYMGSANVLAHVGERGPSLGMTRRVPAFSGNFPPSGQHAPPSP